MLSVFSWRDEDATIELPNSVEYGLTAAVWTNDIKRALNAARKIQCRDGVGQRRRQPLQGHAHGGYKNSGVGRESCLEELLSYTEVKTIQILNSVLGCGPRTVQRRCSDRSPAEGRGRL